MVWLPTSGIYSGENEYSLRPHKPDSVGATPTPATIQTIGVMEAHKALNLGAVDRNHHCLPKSLT